MKKIALTIVVLIGVGIIGFLVFGSKITKNKTPEIWKAKENAGTPAELTVVKEEPQSGKYRFIKDYIVSVCAKTVPGWEGVPTCVNNEYKDKTLFYVGDVVNSYRAFYDDQSTGWGIGLDGLVSGGSNMRIDMYYVEKVPDSTPEKYNLF